MAKGNGPDLSKLSLAELKELLPELQKEIEKRTEEQRQQVLTAMRDLAASIGTTPEQLLRSAGRGKPSPAEPAVRYRHPDDPSLAWTGKGRKPAWVNEALAAGKRLDELEVR